MKIAMIGAGYVGLVSAAGFAEFGNKVICFDTDSEKIKSLNSGVVPFYEPNLANFMKQNVEDGRLSFTNEFSQDILDSVDLVFMAVGTPQSNCGASDMSYFDSAISNLLKFSPKKKTVIVLKSTVPMGTALKLKKKVSETGNQNWLVANNPEFLREGTAVEDFLRPDRVVIGVSDPYSESMLKRLYEPVSNVGPTMPMDHCSAELTKYASNSMIATKISFMNELANISEKVGANIDLVRKAVGMDSRIGPRYLYPGPGFGGSCFTKDLASLAYEAERVGASHSIISSTIQVNYNQKKVPVKKLTELIGDLSGKSVSVWGLAFKPNTDDIRDSPALTVLDDLLALGAKVHVHDPKAMGNIEKIYGDKINYHKSHYVSATNVDGLILVTEWREYRSPDFMYLKSLSPNLSIVDSRNVWREDEAISAEIKYSRIGKSTDLLKI